MLRLTGALRLSIATRPFVTSAPRMTAVLLQESKDTRPPTQPTGADDSTDRSSSATPEEQFGQAQTEAALTNVKRPTPSSRSSTAAAFDSIFASLAASSPLGGTGAAGGAKPVVPGTTSVLDKLAELDKLVNEISKEKELDDIGEEVIEWQSSFANSASKHYYNPQLDIEKELEGQYKFALPRELAEEFDSGSLANVLSFHTASQHDINKWRKNLMIEKFQRKEGDTGTTEVQVGIMTVRINNLTEHMKKNRKDYHSRRGLEMLVQRRRKLLKYLKRVSISRYVECIKALGIRDVLHSESQSALLDVMPKPTKQKTGKPSKKPVVEGSA